MRAAECGLETIIQMLLQATNKQANQKHTQIFVFQS